MFRFIPHGFGCLVLAATGLLAADAGTAQAQTYAFVKVYNDTNAPASISVGTSNVTIPAGGEYRFPFNPEVLSIGVQEGPDRNGVYTGWAYNEAKIGGRFSGEHYYSFRGATFVRLNGPK